MSAAGRDPFVEIWLLDPSAVSPRRLVPCLGWLTGDERQRAEKFATAPLRHAHLCARVVQRLALSRLTGLDPAAFRFAAEPGGRPEIASPDSEQHLSFSLSHTAGLVACAVAAGRRVGLDVEHRDRVLDVEAVASRFFAPAEAAAILAASPQRRPSLFLDHWTVKEAVLKALGTGLATPLDAVRIVRLGDSRVEVAFAPGTVPDAAAWRVFRATPTPHHVLALAVRGDGTAMPPPALAWLTELM